MLKGRINSSRGSRNSALHSRGITRGGIKKNRNCAARLDKDGDLVMDPSISGSKISANENKTRSGRGLNELQGSSRSTGSARWKGSNRASKSGTRRSQQAIIRGIRAQQVTELETLEVVGLGTSKASSDPDGGLESLIGFLERKAGGLDSRLNKAVKIKKSSRVGDSVFITASKQDVAQILKLDKFQFAGVALSIKPCDPVLKCLGNENEGISAEARNLKEELREFLATRYNVELKLLDLSRLGTDPKLQGMGLFKEGVKTAGKLFPAIMAICDGLFKTRKDKQDAITSIALTDNSLSTINHISSLSQTFPDIKNLDLSRNDISDLKAIDAWRWKFRSLEILLLKNNPIESQILNLKTELMKRYPRLHTLNDIRVRSPEEIAAIVSAAENAKTPIPVAGPFFRDVDQVGEAFIRHFIPLYDSDRASLAAGAYDAESTFSLSINMLSPRGSDINIPNPSWTDYVKYSRNLDKVTHLPARMNRQFTGTQSIQAVWASLPETKHPDIDLENDRYLFEGHELPCVPDPTGQSPMGVTGMIINMHGEFKEPQNSTSETITLRSFSRTFILGPGPPGGPVIRVISDLLVLRPWAPLAQPTTTFISNTPYQEKSIPAQNGVHSLEQQQEIIARQFMEHTGMTLQYCLLCLQQAEWDAQRANEIKCSNLRMKYRTAKIEHKKNKT
ncbi:mRNA export factor mex67 [Golovinomyces cichoracearum]|uniref:mRNA export factor mex67 n=1 Tax=Golovinomyces cichoracearum TaxID=62708 RepID=A0A420I6Q9_9PEZI|nr:mRNA export factor mex67 [Golovinomyces cichoracearum]